MQINSVPAGFESGMNNLIWIMQSEEQSVATIVDPGYAEPIINYLKKHSLSVCDILITHHHYDHTDGIPTLLKEFPNSKVYGPKESPCKFITHPLQEGDKILSEGVHTHFEVIETPGHTLDHICYYSAEKQLCFVGDTVFGAGAGGLFEGDAQTFWSSTKKIMQLPSKTMLYYGHDYTLENLYFAKKVEKNNSHIYTHIELCKQNHLYNGCSTVETEHLVNPFWRCDQPEIKAACEDYAEQLLDKPVDVFATLRKWR